VAESSPRVGSPGDLNLGDNLVLIDRSAAAPNLARDCHTVEGAVPHHLGPLLTQRAQGGTSIEVVSHRPGHEIRIRALSPQNDVDPCRATFLRDRSNPVKNRTLTRHPTHLDTGVPGSHGPMKVAELIEH